MSATKAAFLAAYRARLRAECDWAEDRAKLDTFMRGVRRTICGTGATTWSHDSPLARATWREMGGGGRYSLKALRALPTGDLPDA